MCAAFHLGSCSARDDIATAGSHAKLGPNEMAVTGGVARAASAKWDVSSRPAKRLVQRSPLLGRGQLPRSLSCSLQRRPNQLEAVAASFGPLSPLACRRGLRTDPYTRQGGYSLPQPRDPSP